MQYIDAATKFIEDHFPDCSFALVAGSVSPLIEFVTKQLNNCGGRLFDGYNLGK